MAMEQITGTAPEHICNLFRQSCTGSVEMVNSRGIYLLLDAKHILLCHSRYGTVPNGVALAQWDLLPSLLRPGQPVQTEAGIIRFPSAVLEMELRRVPKDTQIHLPREEELQAGINFLLANVKQTGLSGLSYPLFTGQPIGSNLYCDTALPHVKALLHALKEENPETIQLSVCGLLGLGPGLTPSGDDLLSGLVYGLRHGPARDTKACRFLCESIVENASNRTNAVSADYLLAIADDAPFDRMAAAWTDPSICAPELMQIGNNSGGEMLLGLMCAGMIQTR